MSSLRVQLPWQRSGPGVATSRRHSRVNASIFHQQQEDAIDDEEEDQQFRLEVPQLASMRRGSDEQQQQQQQRQQQQQQQHLPHQHHHQHHQHHHQHHLHQQHEEGGHHQPVPVARRRGGGGEGRGGGREGDLDLMSASSWSVSHLQPSASASSQRERRAQIDSCWFNIPDMFMDPASRVAYYWMALVTVAVVYNWIVIILRVAFEDMRDSEFHQRMFRVLDTVCDVIYLLDVAIQSRTAYLEDGCLVRSLPETVRHYRSQPHFPLDVLSVVPLTSLLSYLTKIGLPCPFESGFNSLTTPGLRILRLLKYPSMTRFFEKTDSRTNNPNVLRAFRLSLHLWLVIHWIGCFYYLVSQFEGLGSNDWVYPNTTEFAPFRRKYIYCMYWSTMTLTTIGERPWPVTDVEYIFTGVTFLIGVFVFAAVVGNVGDVISNMNAARHDFQARMDQIKFYLNHRNIPEPLQDQIKRWAEYTWARTKAIDEHSVLQLLPSRLRTEVAIHVHLKTLKKVRIFEQCEEGLLRELVLKLRPSIYSPGEYICRIGEIGREMYIIDHGKVEILFPEHGTGQMKQVAIMMPGNYFGEISLLKLDDGQNRRTADVRSVGFSELLCLSRRDLMAALMEYPEAKKILEAQARQRILQTKRTPREDTEADALSAFPGHSESGHSLSGSEFRSGRRSARAIFAQVMRQEGFSKLLASTANEELSEMKKILQELREIKNQLSQTSLHQDGGQEDLDEELKRDENLQQIRTQLLLQTGALMTPSSLTSASGSTLTNAADLSSDTSTLTSPTMAQCLSLTPNMHPRHTPSTGKSSARHLPLPLKPSTQYVSPDRMAVPAGVLSKHGPQLSAKAAKVLPPYGCFVSPPSITSPLLLSSPSPSSPEALAAHPRRRRSPPGRVPKSTDKDPLDSVVDLVPEDLADMSSLPVVVAQCGGGDEPVLAAAEKEPSPKNVEEQRRVPIAVLKSLSSTDSCTESLPAAAFLGVPVGSHSSVEFLDPSVAKPKKHGPKPTALRAYSESLGPLASSDSFRVLISGSNSSSYTSTSYSTTSTSSGGRGHSPKPAKPRPRYRKEDMLPICTQDNAQNEGSARCLEGTSPSELQKNSNALAQCQDRGDIPAESHLSSDELAAVFKGSSWNSTDSQKSPLVEVCSSSSLTHLPATEPAEASLECADTKQQPCPVNADTENSDSVSKEVKSAMAEDNGASKLHTGDLSEGPVHLSDSPHEHVSPPTDSRAEETLPWGPETDLAKLPDSDLNPEPADPPKTDGGELNTVEADDCPQNEEDGQRDCSEDSDDGSGDGFIAATRVRSDFDKRVPKKELADIPRTVTCRKIDDSQLTILLARRREANDSVGNVSESPAIQNSCLAEVDGARTEHSHSIQAVIKSTTASHSAGKVACSELFQPKHHTTSRQKQASGNKGESKDTSLLEANSEQADSRFEAERESPLTKNVPELADVQRQTDLKAKDVLCDEDVVTDEIDINKCKEFHMKVYEDKHLPSEMNGRLEEGSEQGAQDGEDEADGTRDGSCTTATPRFTSEGNPKPYPASILKKTRVQDIEPDENTQRQQQLETHIPTQNSLEVTAREEKHATVCDSEMQGGNRDLSPLFSSAKCVPQICTENKQEDSLTTLLQQQSASQCHDTDSDKRPESEPKSGSCTEAEPGQEAAQTKCAVVNSPRASGLVSASRPPAARRHSEKLDSLIAAFDNRMKFHDGDSRKNSVVNLTETNTSMNPDVKIGSKELVEPIKEECTEKCTVVDSVGGSTSPTQTHSPVSPCAKAEDEARTNYTSSSQVGSPQKRKTLKRRHLAKRVWNPYEKSREQACPDKTNVPSSDLSTEIASLMSETESKKSTPQKPPPSENITMCVPLVKSLVWETDSDKKPSSSSSVSQGTPSPLLEEKSNCSSTSLVSSVRASSKFFFDSELGRNTDSADGGEEVSVEETLSKCGSPVSNRHIASSAEDLSVREAVDCFRPGESLDKANNSAVVYSSSVLSSDSSSDCLLTISTCASHLPWRPADPDADLQVREQVCFKTSYDAGLSPPSSLPCALETSDVFAAEEQQGISDNGVGNTQHTCVHSHSSPPQLTVAAEGCAPSDRKPVPHTLATHDSRLQGNVQADHSNTELRTGASPEACTRVGGACTQNTHSSHPTGFDPQSGRTAEPRTRTPGHPRQQRSPAQPAALEARYPQPPEEKQTAQAADASLPHAAPHGEHVQTRPKGSRKLKARHLLPGWLDSPGASSTDESGGDGAAEGEAEAINSFILLADFGVEEDDDDEGALSGLSGCGDHSDINSDLDDL